MINAIIIKVCAYIVAVSVVCWVDLRLRVTTNLVPGLPLKLDFLQLFRLVTFVVSEKTFYHQSFN